ncbi:MULTISPECIES: double-strand break repair protein AddB [Methylosinus]|uniref:Double-strand break repair protein AddB n=1 Tax=Methylosinus trichosporium (strain ATCC 35070 / NCIMB 11131 / UNIQEM 75 / OB3b) TaxID=595536 RepID=A0A2D2CZK9_METT3|nr:MULTISPECIES: double-strand break repair protein AddB [Methylosinus]ATQ68069.1 double-strand break repair protein AddB [Methylosinus trichosporium OB3b]OBS51518.1 double-strand break repair protein AddB [Methylosinus sp. 3S-1]
MAPRNVFSIPPGASFLGAFTRALLDGEIIPGLSRASGPLALAETTIYVPTRRAARALAAQLAAAIETPAALLPRILPLGDLDEQEASALFHAEEIGSDDALAPAVAEIDRRLTLAALVLHWAKSLRHAIVAIDPLGRIEHDPREMLLVAPSPASACALAEELARLVDEFIIEDVDPKALGSLAEDAHDRYFAITTHFLRIALEDWPKILKERECIDGATRRKALVAAQIDALTRGAARGPVIALGSTGAQPTTARLIAAIERLETGAVVLPGLDLEMDEASWRRVGETSVAREEAAVTHPQAMLKRLIGIIGVARAEVRRIGAPPAAIEARGRLLAAALKPADSTDLWRAFREAHGASFDAALAGVSFIEAADEREEALALALCMREALETPGRTAALVTPDRMIARRVCAELARWDIEVDDSAGRPLAATPIGALARLVAASLEDGVSAVDAAALLAHPLTSLGLGRAEIARIAPLVEIGVLRNVERRPGPLAEMAAAARARARGQDAAPALRRIADADWRAIEDALARLDAALAPLATLPAEAPLTARVRAHAEALERIIGAEAAGEGAEQWLELVDALAAAGGGLAFDAGGYSSFFDRLAFETAAPSPRRAHPRLKILGLLEARLLDADLVLLAGLDETIWPPQAETGAFLNRTMRAQLGLSPPERRIGQTAHDFSLAFCAREVVLSRSRKRDGSPTVVSRFVARLAALAGENFSACKARGDRARALAAALDHPAEIRAAARPLPRPPVELRPVRLSVTRIEKLRRDPYSVFAEHVLRLAPLPPLGAEKGAREIGVAVHAALAKFSEAHPKGPLPEDASERLLILARAELAEFLDDPSFIAFQWPRLETGLRHALAFERERRKIASETFIEIRGEWRLPLADGGVFTLSCVADRIELDAAGAAFVVDYKTGTPPSVKQVDAGFSPQLTLEAAMIEAGAFPPIGVRAVSGAAYVRLGGKDGGETRELKFKDKSFSDVVAEHRANLLELLNQFRDPATPYPSRPFVEFASRYGDYDHLARVAEWSRDGGGAGEE